MSVSFHGEDPSESDRAVATAALVTAGRVVFGGQVLLVVFAFVGAPVWEMDQGGKLRLAVSTPAARTLLARTLSFAEARKLKVRPLVEVVMQRLKGEGVGLVVGPPPDMGTALPAARKKLSE
jgi:hypothetical protein